MLKEVSDDEATITQELSALSYSKRQDDYFSKECGENAPTESSDEQSTCSRDDKLRELEVEQERLNDSLLLLSTHFAQVQFRLKQISQADCKDRDILLKDLQEFAFKGCADISEIKRQTIARNGTKGEREETIERQRERQMELIVKLKDQLEELEKFAYEAGEGGLPSSELIVKQKAVIDKLHEKVKLNLELDKMSPSDLQKQVDEALKQLLNPMRAKQQLVEQLQTQIVDLERFVSFLQGENIEMTPTSFSSTSVKPRRKGAFLGIFWGCRSEKFECNELKSTMYGNHYGDVRAVLELTVDKTVKVLDKYLLLSVDDDPSNKNEMASTAYMDEVFERSEQEVVCVIRKELCPALRALLEHGLNSAVAQPSSTFVPFGCFSVPSDHLHNISNGKASLALKHIWDVIMFYYDSKWGKGMSDAPYRRLSQSFQLEDVNGRTITSKQMLLSTIENIIATHYKLKRTSDAMWKAFVSAALNEKRLPAWIRMIFRTRHVVQYCYASWSYVARTGCEDCYELLESLHRFTFTLPVDLAVRPFRQMKDAF